MVSQRFLNSSVGTLEEPMNEKKFPLTVTESGVTAEIRKVPQVKKGKN
jgi:hypothetical protein